MMMVSGDEIIAPTVAKCHALRKAGREVRREMEVRFEWIL